MMSFPHGVLTPLLAVSRIIVLAATLRYAGGCILCLDPRQPTFAIFYVQHIKRPSPDNISINLQISQTISLCYPQIYAERHKGFFVIGGMSSW